MDLRLPKAQLLLVPPAVYAGDLPPLILPERSKFQADAERRSCFEGDAPAPAGRVRKVVSGSRPRKPSRGRITRSRDVSHASPGLNGFRRIVWLYMHKRVLEKN